MSSDPVYIKRMISINPSKAEKLIKRAKKTGNLPPMKIAQLETKLEMAKWNVQYKSYLQNIGKRRLII